MHFVNTYSTSESTITGFVDEIAKIERWPYAGTDMAMMGFKSINSEGTREDVNLTALNSIITSADSTRKITFLYTNNSQILSSYRQIISNYFPYLNILIAPKILSLPHNFIGLSISYLQLDQCTTIAQSAFVSLSIQSYSDPRTGRIEYHFIIAQPPSAAKLKTVILPNIQRISSLTFAYTGLESLSAPKLQAIDTYVFRGTLLSILQLPSCNTIGHGAFCQCINLKQVELPAVSEIDTTAFSSCPLLESVYLNSSSMATISSTAFNETPLVSTDTSAAIYVPSSLISNYQEAYSEFPFSDKFKPIVGDIL